MMNDEKITHVFPSMEFIKADLCNTCQNQFIDKLTNSCICFKYNITSITFNGPQRYISKCKNFELREDI